MSHADLGVTLEGAADAGCVEALFCLGDQPESAFASYRDTLARYGHQSTVDYLHFGAQRALERGLLPHTNAGILSREAMRRLRAVNVSLGLMLECTSERLCARGMPHHRAPDKRPMRRMAMVAEAGELSIPFTTGLLVGIGETPRERVETLLAIRELHQSHGHIQEVIVQNFTPHAGTLMETAPEPGAEDVSRTVALARLILDDDVSVQAPPNLNPERTALLVASGINDFGGISPVTPDFINPDRPWPHIARLQQECWRLGFELRPRLPIYDAYLESDRFLDPALRASVDRARARLGSLGSGRTTATRDASAGLTVGAS